MEPTDRRGCSLSLRTDEFQTLVDPHALFHTTLGVKFQVNLLQCKCQHKQLQSCGYIESTNMAHQQTSESSQSQVKPCCQEQHNLYMEALGRLQVYDVYCRDQALHLNQALNTIGEYRMAYEFQCLQNQYLLQAVEEKHQALILEKQQVALLHSSLLSMQNCQSSVNPGMTTSNNVFPRPGTNLGMITDPRVPIPAMNDFVMPIVDSASAPADYFDDIEIDVVNVSPSPPNNSRLLSSKIQDPRDGQDPDASYFKYPLPPPRERPNIAGGKVSEVRFKKPATLERSKEDSVVCSKQQAELTMDLSSIRWKPFDFAAVNPVQKGPASVSGYAVVKVDMVRGKNSSLQHLKRKNYCNFVAKIKEEALMDGQKVYSVCYMKRKCSFLKDEKSTCFVADNSGGDYLCLEEDVVVYLPDPYEDRRGKIHFNKNVDFQGFSLYQ
ncbi:unnamed protein product [Allacma fusca]|uniref:Uncharacterized protein n=1 Tax=Allacma fusca TaxID=39272 RepID=A0A8J2NUV8_9HEXA|nr:unnamed protein product [Allacma fusca]